MKFKAKPPYAFVAVLLIALASSIAATTAKAQDPLPSWNEGPAKKAIVLFNSGIAAPAKNMSVPAPMKNRPTFSDCWNRPMLRPGTCWIVASIPGEATAAAALRRGFERLDAVRPKGTAPRFE